MQPKTWWKIALILNVWLLASFLFVIGTVLLRYSGSFVSFLIPFLIASLDTIVAFFNFLMHLPYAPAVRITDMQYFPIGWALIAIILLASLVLFALKKKIGFVLAFIISLVYAIAGAIGSLVLVLVLSGFLAGITVEGFFWFVFIDLVINIVLLICILKSKPVFFETKKSE